MELFSADTKLGTGNFVDSCERFVECDSNAMRDREFSRKSSFQSRVFGKSPDLPVGMIRGIEFEKKAQVSDGKHDELWRENFKVFVYLGL